MYVERFGLQVKKKRDGTHSKQWIADKEPIGTWMADKMESITSRVFESAASLRPISIRYLVIHVFAGRIHPRVLEYSRLCCTESRRATPTQLAYDYTENTWHRPGYIRTLQPVLDVYRRTYIWLHLLASSMYFEIIIRLM